MAIVVVLAGSWLGYQSLAEDKCSGQIKLTVAAATEIAPAVERAAQQWITGGANVNGTCVAVNVTGVNPSTTASALALKHGIALTGLGPGGKAVPVPDVWLPDSSTWLVRLRTQASGFVPTDGKSIAQSPVVVAMPEPVAQQVGWPDRKLGWSDLVARMTTGNSLRTGIVDPTRDAAGLAGLLALGSATGSDQKARATQVGALRALAAGSSSLRDDLLQKFPRSLDAADLASSISAAPLSEEDVIAYNAERPQVKLAALYLEPTPPALDYPFAVMPGVDLTKSAAATGLRQALEQPSFKNELASRGLRAADGTVGTGFAAPIGAPQASGAPAPAASSGTEGTAAASGLDPGALNRALGTWAAITLPGRALAVFDVSGSMLTKVPTAGNKTRADVTRLAAAQGLALFDDKWAVGTWIFSTNLVGKQPWKVIEPIQPLSSGRTALQASIDKIRPKAGGQTGLYDTALAAYRNVQDTWQAGKVNSVLLFTDGRDDNASSIDRETLVAELKKLADPTHPVRLVIIGIGDEVDRAELDAIAKATRDGGVFVAPDPAKISDIFLEAISSRSGAAS